MGEGAYMIAKQQATGFPGLGNMKSEIIAEGVKYCTSIGKKFQLTNTQETQPPYILGNYPRSEIQFMCLSASSKVQKKKTVTQPNKQNIRDSEIFSVASGTGFMVTDKGHIITNNHVINGCDNVKTYQKGQDYPVTIIATDSVNDLALLKTTLKTKDVLSLSNKNAFLMQDVFVAGYPFGKSVSSSVKVTKGIVSALSGLRNNYSNMQIDAALQPGNSGGPILDEKGNAVGVAVAKLSLAKAVKDWGVVPEGTNFGIKSSVVRNFMESNNVNPMPPRTSSITKQQLAQKVTNSTLYLSCWMTYAKIKQMKSEKVMFTNFE